MAGWQITLIAVGAALVAATAAVVLDRTLAARRPLRHRHVTRPARAVTDTSRALDPGQGPGAGPRIERLPG